LPVHTKPTKLKKHAAGSNTTATGKGLYLAVLADVCSDGGTTGHALRLQQKSDNYRA